MNDVISELNMPTRVLFAYQIYITNHNVTKTAEIVGVNRATIHRWKKTYGCDELQRKVLISLIKGDEKSREYTIKIQKAIVKRIQEGIKLDEIKIRNVKDFIALLRYQLELEGGVLNKSQSEPSAIFDLEGLHKELEERRKRAERLAKGSP